MLKFCPECGSKLIGGRFCGDCGADLNKYGVGNSGTGSTLDDALAILWGLQPKDRRKKQLRVISK